MSAWDWPRVGPGRPWVIAHRGDSAHAPENTIEAARRAREAGAVAWELDVQLTRDGTPIVIHDPTLVRTTDVARRFEGDARGPCYFVADFDLAEIQLLDAGSWFVDPEGGLRSALDFGTLSGLDPSDRVHWATGGVRVPTLAEALVLTDQLDWRVNVELKSLPAADPRLVDAVLDAIDATQTAGRVWVSSFDHAELARLAARRPALATGLLAAGPLERPADYVRDWVGAWAYHPSVEALGGRSTAYRRFPSPRGLRAEDLNACARRGVPTFAYTVNDPAVAGHLFAAGVSGLFTDDPAALAAF